MFSMRCDEQNLHYLDDNIRDFWTEKIFQGDREAMRKVDRPTVKGLELTAPGACKADFEDLYGKVQSGKIFGAFDEQDREDLWRRVLSASVDRLIPSLFSFFEDLNYLKNVADCVKRLVPLSPRSTISAALEGAFTDANQRAGQCMIQESESTCVPRPGGLADRVDLGQRQIWMNAMRDHPQMPAVPKRKKLSTKPITGKADEIVLCEFAAFANRLGFESEEIRGLIQRSADDEIARSVLLKACKPDRYKYDKAMFEDYVGQIVSLFSGARPITVEQTSAAVTTDRFDGPPKRCGIPYALDHERDRLSLFLDRLHNTDGEQSDQLSSFFIRRSVYFAFFGKPTRPSPRPSLNSPEEMSPLGTPISADLGEDQVMEEQEEQDRLTREQAERRRLEKEEQERQDRPAREEAERQLAREEAEQQRLEREQLEQQQLKQERLEQERLTRLEQERLEQERLARLEQERLEQERLTRLEQARLEQERLARLEQERLEQERLEQERLARLEQARLEQERLTRLEQERLEQERLEQERLEQERLARLEQERLEQEKLTRLEQERFDQNRYRQERQEQERLAKEKQEELANEEKRKEQERLEEEQKRLAKNIANQWKLKQKKANENQLTQKESNAPLSQNIIPKGISAKRSEKRLTQLDFEKVINSRSSEINDRIVPPSKVVDSSRKDAEGQVGVNRAVQSPQPSPTENATVTSLGESPQHAFDSSEQGEAAKTQTMKTPTTEQERLARDEEEQVAHEKQDKSARAELEKPATEDEQPVTAQNLAKQWKERQSRKLSGEQRQEQVNSKAMRSGVPKGIGAVNRSRRPLTQFALETLRDAEPQEPIQEGQTPQTAAENERQNAAEQEAVRNPTHRTQPGTDSSATKNSNSASASGKVPEHVAIPEEQIQSDQPQNRTLSGDQGSDSSKVDIQFSIFERGDWKSVYLLSLDLSDPSGVSIAKRAALKYMRKRIYMFDTKGHMLTPETYIKDVTEDGTNAVYLMHEKDIDTNLIPDPTSKRRFNFWTNSQAGRDNTDSELAARREFHLKRYHKHAAKHDSKRDP
ncbi:hypothetical protein F5884DRAFT_758143 [Xylogone sp. PMI_703]|nr:hypothetical protein F5884DRAFT_758143 [Xylogone sp. PMI_703]